MSGYQIDEVRELFTSDMNRFMSDLEVRAAELRDELAVIRERAQVIERAQGALTVSFHGIAGTSSLLSVASSHSLAGYLETMMHGLDSSVRSVLREGERLDAYRQACDLGISALRAIIDDELRGDRASADRRSAEALSRVKRTAQPSELAVVSTRPAEPLAAVTPTDTSSADDERTELLAVFREELRGAMADARTQLDELEHGPDRGAALSRLGSVLHMMKGSAASVGESALSIELRSIYELVEDFLDRGELPDAAATRRIRSELLASVPEPAPEAPASIDQGWDSAAPEDDGVDPEELFRTEAHELLRQARTRFEDLGRDPAAVREDLGRIFHRIKGSALVVGLPDLGAVAADLERAARQHGPLELTHLDRLAALIATGRAAPAPAPVTERARATREPVPNVVTGELWDSFAEESTELLETIERAARELERTTNLGATVTTLLGAFHTLKGAANTVGLSPVGRELHVVETMLESLRAAPSSKRRSFVLTRLFDVLERLRRNLRTAPRGEVECAAEVLEQDLGKMANLEAHSVETPSGHSWLPTHDSAWSERPRSAVSAGPGGSSREHSSDHQSIDRAPGSSGTGGTGKPAGGERRFIRVAAERLDSLMDMVGELIVTRSRVNAGLTALATLHEEQEQRRGRLVAIVDGFTEQAEYANLGGVARRSRRAGAGPAISDFGALEFDVYEEVHVLARRLAEASSDVNDTSAEIATGMAQLSDSTEELGGIVSTLQSQINRARMVPLEALFARLALPARDAAERERKLVDVTMQGAEVVVDKAIADALYAPMLHLVRNSVAHGIESGTRRRAAGKPERGNVTLSARQEAGEIVISVADDGGGIDVAALHREGLARGILGRDVPVDAPEVLELVFSAGLSTSATTNDVAGRGMGGDVVRRTVQRLGGSVRVVNQPGQGATFVLRLPVTLAITRAVVIRQGRQLFGIPLLFVERILRREDLQELQGGEQRRIRHGDDLLSVFRILPGENAESVFLICSVGGRRLAIEADEVVAHDEVVVKPLGQVLDGHPLFAGASQRGDGELALIMDMHGVAEAHTGIARPMVGRSSGAPAATAAPAPEAPAPGDAGASPVQPVAHPAGPRQLRVLFVDDSLSVRKVAENTLRKLGVVVITASDGRDALDRLRDSDISLVFTDLEMPRMHGYELIQEMRYIPAYHGIPIVVVSSRSGDKHVQKALEAGANEYLTKPFSAETLSGALQKLIPSFRPEGA